MAFTITSNRNSEFALNRSDTADNPLTIAAGVTVSASGSYAIYTSYYQSWNITNLGTLLGKYGVLLNDADTSPGSVLTNSGTAALISGTDIGVEVFGSFATVTNQGTIIGGSRDGVDLDSDSDSVTNSGGAALIQGGRDGVYANATPNATAVVTNSGTISGTSGDGVFLTGGGSVTNSTTSALIEGYTNGVAAAGTSTAIVTNFGTINGGAGDGVSLAAGGKVTNSGTGAAIYGGANAIYATNVSVAVVNTGLILSTNVDGVYLDAGGAVTNNATTAVVDGYVYGVRVKGAAGTVVNLGHIIANVAAVDFLNGGTLANNGTAALVVGGYWGAYFGASGGAVTVTNQGTIAGHFASVGVGVNFGDGGALTNSGTGALVSGADYGIVASGQYLTLVNNGRIIGSSGGGVYLGAGATLTNSASAQIDGAASGIVANNTAIHVVNQGTIAGTGTSSVGVELESGGTLTNSGTGALIYGTTIGIQAIVKPFTLVNYAKISANTGIGVYFGAGGSVTNGATAQIDGATYGVLASNSALGVVNQGTIVGTSKDGVYLKDGGTITNSGTAALISGDFGVKVRGGAATVTNQGSIVGATNAGVYVADGGTVTNSATGQLDGDANGVVGLDFAIGIVNQGSIAGTTKAGIYLQDGGTITNSGTAARISGAKYGINVHTDAATVSNQGSIVGTTSDGVYLAAGGTVTNSGTAALISGATYGIKIHSGAATVIAQGTISGATAAVQFANASGNFLELYPGATLSGVVKGVSGTATLDLASGSAAGAISGIGSQYTGFDTFDAAAGAHWTMSGTNTIAALATLSLGAAATLTVSGKLVSLGQPTLAGSGTIVLSGTGSMEVGTSNNATAGEFLIEQSQTVVTDGAVSLNNVVNRGAVTGLGSYGLYLGAGGTVTNFGFGHVSGVDDGIAAKGTATASVDNVGTITGTNAAGVYLGAGGSVTNTGISAVISGQDYGVKATVGAAAIVNSGSIISPIFAGVYIADGGSVTNASTASVISGRIYGIDAQTQPATITNLGSITSQKYGVYLGDGGTIANNGTAALISGDRGVKANGPAAVTNQGTIAGSFNYGVWLAAGGTVTDSGSIIGPQDAVLFGGGVDNRLVVDPGAVFSGGIVDGGNAVGDPATSTLELATGTSAGTLHGLGSQYVNFAQTTIDAGASWALTGSNSLASGATLTNSGTLVLSSATLTDSGVLQNNGSITLDPSTLTVGILIGTGVVTIATGGSLEAQGTVASGETIAFAGSNAELHLDAPDNFSGSVTSLGLGDLIDLQGIAPGSVHLSNGTLSFAGGSFALALNGTPAVQAISSADGTVFEVVGPVIAGTAPDQPVTDVTTIDPFSGVAITDSNAGQTETVAVTMSDIANGELSNLGTGTLSDGVYTDTGTAAQVSTALDGLVFTPTLDTGPLGHTISTTFTIQATDTAGAVATDSTTSVVASAAPALVTLATFTGGAEGNGAKPIGGLVADSSGDLFGTTSNGGSDSDGTEFEIAKSGGVFASTPTTLLTFDGGNGASPQASLIIDAAGDLLGTTAGGGADEAGTVFEYSTSPTTLATFSDANNIGYRPVAGVIADAEGDLFGTVRFPSGANDGAVFEIANGTTTVTQVVGFTGGDDGGAPEGPLIADAAGDLFGTTSTGGAGGQGTVFEIAYNGTSYATTATTLVTFNLAGSADGANPLGGLITDANGDLFGTTSSGGAHGDGTVFEIAYNGTSYATMATTLVNFDGTGDGANPADTLLIDSNGNLYGTTQNGGAAGDGTVFELAKTETGYASTPTTLVTFNGSGNGANPYAGLIADPAGDLFGTTQNGGTDGDGTVFEVVSTGANFDPLIAGTAANQAVTDAATIDPFSAVTITDPKSGQTETVTVTLSNAANGSLVHLSGGNFSDGVYTYTGTAAQVTLVLDGLRFLPTDHQVAPGQTVTTTFTIADTDTFGATATDSTSSVVATAVAVPIAIIGTAADQEATDRSTINPFANVTISDPNAGQTETVTLTLSTTANGTLTNLGGFIATATLGVYTDTNTAAAVTMDLQGLVFTPTFYPGVVGETATTGFTIADTDTTGENATDSTTTVIATAVPILTTLVTFNSTGENPHAGLIADAAGDLFGTTAEGAGSSYGTVFEIARTGVGIFATSPTTLVTFTGTGNLGAQPYGGLIADAAGDLLGTTPFGGDDNADGTVFVVAKTATGYATTATTLIAFNGAGDGSTPYAGVISDAAGDLFGMTSNSGPGGGGTVFEIANNGTGYATTPTTLVSFNGGNGANPSAGLVANAAGDLFGTEAQGAVFEIADTGAGYATSPTTLATFSADGSEGADPLGTLIIDAAGNLIGTTYERGPGGDGTVFEIANTANGYASTPITLVSFNGTGNGAFPYADLIADAAGDLFGTTSGGGADGDGTVFEIANTITGYASTAITLATFDGTSNGADPYGGLIADAAGDLFGTTESGGSTGDGTAFELTDTGLTFAPVISGTQAGQQVTDAATIDPFAGVTITDGNSGQTETVTVTLSNALNGTLSNLGGGSYAAGIYTDTGTAAEVTAALDGLVFTPAAQQVAIGQTVTTTFTLDDVNTANAVATDTTTSVIATAAPPLTTLFTFNGTLNGADPVGGLLADANGDLFGMTGLGGANKDGTVFELVKSGGTYAATPTTLVTFAGTSNGKSPAGGLIANAAGDLFAETQAGGGSGDGTVFEIVNNSSTGYATSPTTLATFTGVANGATLFGGLIMNAAGDLLGTTSKGGADNDGTVFEMVNTDAGYAAPTTLVTFDGTGNGATPESGLLADAAGDLFGTTNAGGADGDGTVFEISNSITGYATTPTTVATFTGAGTGAEPFGSLITDAAGDLFGVTMAGGADGDGTVFEIANTGTGYGATPITLLTFDGAGNGATPGASLIADAAGDLFGTTESGGAGGDGTVFELAKTETGYAATPTTLVTFIGTANGSDPRANLIADAAGDLFGSTQNGGGDNDGTLFELTDTGLTFAPAISGTASGQAVTDRTTLNPFASVTITDGNSGQTETVTVTLSSAANGTLSNLGGGSFSDGVYSDTGTAAQVSGALQGLVFTPTAGQVAAGKTVTTGFTIVDTNTATASATDSTTTVVTTDTGPRTLTWTGAANTGFTNAANWDDTTFGYNPALWAENASDTVAFDSGGRVISGTGTAAAISFGGDGAWELATGTDLTTPGSVTVGGTQPGELVIDAGASLIGTGTAGAIIGNQSGAAGSSVNVTGTGSNWQIGGALDVGNAAEGSLNITAGGSVSAGSIDTGVLAGSFGDIVVNGTASQLTATGQFTVGDSANADMAVSGGATIDAGNFDIGLQAGASGVVDVEGSSVINVANAFNVGDAGNAVLSLGADATVNTTSFNIGTAGVLIEFGDPINSGTVTNSNSIVVNGGSNVTTATDEFVNDGLVEVENSGTETINTPLITGTGSMQLSTDGDLVLNANSIQPTQTIVFADATGTLTIGTDALGGFDSTISGFQAGDQIIVQTTAAATFSQNGSIVSVIANGTTLGELAFANTAQAALAASTDGALADQVICFCAGTQIATPSGEVAVEQLAVGNVVLTHRGEARPITWIGVGRVLATRGRRSAATPVVLRKGALADNVPHHDLRVTKGHSFYLDGVLIPVEFLVNHRSIEWDDRAQEVILYHLELASHDVLLANGALAESYRDDGNRWLFRNANSGWALPPQVPCAPVLTGGAVVDAVWRRLLERAGPRPSLPLTEDPDLHVLMDGRRLDAMARVGEAYVFHLPTVPSVLRIVSRAAVPAELGLARDPRVLGVALRRLVVRKGTRFRVAEANDDRLTDGFHAFEAGNGLRWTDGDAAIQAELFAGFTGPLELVLQIGGVARYPADHRAQRAA